MFRCVPGEANDDPLIDALKEDVDIIKFVMERGVRVMSFCRSFH